MANDDRDILELLKEELDFIEINCRLAHFRSTGLFPSERRNGRICAKGDCRDCRRKRRFSGVLPRDVAKIKEFRPSSFSESKAAA